MSEKKTIILLISLLLLKAACMVWVISTGEIGLGPDEAQYWTWSQALDWGYYSKPPGIAWQIWSGTQFFGNTELGVRFASILSGVILPLLVYGLARACALLPRTAFWAALIMALTPLGVMGSLLAITDVGMMIFWTAACIVIVRALERHAEPSYVLIGTCIFLGALFKWPIYFLWIWILLGWYFFSNLRSKHLLGGMLISLLGLLPSLAWNTSHRWATFHHVFSTVQGAENRALFQGNVLDFIGAQAVLISPLLFIFLISALVYSFRHPLKPSLFFCAFSSFVTLAIFCAYALLKKMQGNWCIFIYPTLIVYLSWYLCEKVTWGKKALVVSLALSVVLAGVGLSIPFLQSHNIANLHIPYKASPFKHNVGWKRMQVALDQQGYHAHEHFLFGDRYQMSSLLSFYNTGQKRAYFFNLDGIRKNQFSFWPDMSHEQVGKTGFFAHVENIPFHEGEEIAFHEKLSPYFEHVEFLGAFPIFEAYNQPVKRLLLFKCSVFLGKQPSEGAGW
ncbi:ArnT family glycosyltransferase [Parachlamydia acanthamoebae]|uniref:ArnT family glycosyltransferase n=1 Tax=Parachlamydia acanthamoebae TaxID=83552 RepID=UPI00075109EB|nr:glycosyltransferase family 39 protein [Parachlamydia acanthamoebae]